MRLATAAAYFDRTLCQDTFNPGTTFYGQFDVFDDSKRDGATVVRRVLSLAPSVTIPSRRVITVEGAQWIIGQHEEDYWLGAALRRKYVLQRADGAATIRTVGEAIQAAGGASTYAARLWVKDQKELENSSKLSAMYNVYLPTYDTVSVGAILGLSGRLHVIRNFLKSAGGFQVAECEELEPSPIVSATYRAVTYTPATDTNAEAPTAVTILRTRYQVDYEYVTEAQPKYVEGDIKAYVRKAQVASPAAKDKVTISGVSWLVLSVNDENDAWGLHLRRAGA